MTNIFEIRLQAVPLDLYGLAVAQVDALQREFEMILRDDPDGGSDHVPMRLHTLIQQLRGMFDGYGEHADQQLAAAHDRGDAHVDLLYHAPAEVGPACSQLLDLLADADAYCRAGDLMTLATRPDVLAFRAWFLGEFTRQVDGREPRPWSSVETKGSTEPAAPSADRHATSHEEASPGAEQSDGPGWALWSEGSILRLRFSGDLDLVSAPHLRSLVADGTQTPDLTELALDLSGVTFLDSVGLSVLLAVRMRLVSDEVKLTVVASDSVERVFTLAGVRDLFLAGPDR